MAEPHVDFPCFQGASFTILAQLRGKFPPEPQAIRKQFQGRWGILMCVIFCLQISPNFSSRIGSALTNTFQPCRHRVEKISSLKISKTCGGQNRLGYSWQQCVDCGKPWWWYSSKDWWVGPRKPHLIMGITRASPTPKVQRWYLHCGVNQQQTIFPGRGALAPWISTAGLNLPALAGGSSPPKCGNDLNIIQETDISKKSPCVNHVPNGKEPWIPYQGLQFTGGRDSPIRIDDGFVRSTTSTVPAQYQSHQHHKVHNIAYNFTLETFLTLYTHTHTHKYIYIIYISHSISIYFVLI